MNNDCRNPKVYYVEGGREGGGSAALQDRDGTPIGKCTGLIPAADSGNADTVGDDGTPIGKCTGSITATTPLPSHLSPQ